MSGSGGGTARLLPLELVCQAVLVVLLLLVAPPVHAQHDGHPVHARGQESRSLALRPNVGLPDLRLAAPGIDARMLLAVHRSDGPVMRVWMRTADASSYPVFVGAPVAAWGGAWLRDDGDYRDAYRLTLSAAGTYAIVKGLKLAAGRPRPYATVPGVTSRSDRYRPGTEGTYESFPSGHASMAFAQATSYSLSHPRWYVVAPTMLWAGSVTLSRPWLGVHYPSDVLTGAVLGAGVATAVHLLGPHLTPAALEPDPQGPAPTAAVVLLRVGL